MASGLLSLTRTLGQTVGTATVAAMWATRVAAHAHRSAVSEAAAAPAVFQVTALSETLHIVVALVAVALFLSLWALWHEHRLRTVRR